MPKLRDHTTILSRVDPRRRGVGLPRFYGDFRDYADVGGAMEPLFPSECRYATTDPEKAKELAAARLKQLEEKRAERPVGDADKWQIVRPTSGL